MDTWERMDKYLEIIENLEREREKALERYSISFYETEGVGENVRDW